MQHEVAVTITRFPQGYSPFIYVYIPEEPICARNLSKCVELWTQFLFTDPVLEWPQNETPVRIPLSRACPQLYRDLLAEAQRITEAVQGCIYSGSTPVLVDSKTGNRMSPKFIRAAGVLDYMQCVAQSGSRITPWLGKLFKNWVHEQRAAKSAVPKVQ